MKIVSIGAILLLLAHGTIGSNDPGIVFWNLMFGFAGMLAVFNLLNLKIRWAAIFGAVAYVIIFAKTFSQPIIGDTVTSGPVQLTGLAAAAGYCVLLFVHSLKNRGPSQADSPATKKIENHFSATI